MLWTPAEGRTLLPGYSRLKALEDYQLTPRIDPLPRLQGPNDLALDSISELPRTPAGPPQVL